MTLEVNASGGEISGIQELLNISEIVVVCAEHQMLSGTDHRLDLHDAMQWAHEVWDEPLIMRECVATSPFATP